MENRKPDEGDAQSLFGKTGGTSFKFELHGGEVSHTFVIGLTGKGMTVEQPKEVEKQN